MVPEVACKAFIVAVEALKIDVFVKEDCTVPIVPVVDCRVVMVPEVACKAIIIPVDTFRTEVFVIED